MTYHSNDGHVLHKVNLCQCTPAKQYIRKYELHYFVNSGCSVAWLGIFPSVKLGQDNMKQYSKMAISNWKICAFFTNVLNYSNQPQPPYVN